MSGIDVEYSPNGSMWTGTTGTNRLPVRRLKSSRNGRHWKKFALGADGAHRAAHRPKTTDADSCRNPRRSVDCVQLLQRMTHGDSRYGAAHGVSLIVPVTTTDRTVTHVRNHHHPRGFGG